MDASEIVKAINELPIKRNASLGQKVLMAGFVAVLFAAGWMASNATKQYFDEWHAGVILAITKVDTDQSAKVDAISKRVDQNVAEIDSLRHWYWSFGDQSHYMQTMDRANRASVPGLIIPEVPAPPNGPH